MLYWYVSHQPFDQVAKLKGDEREDLKVLATGVAAALAARKVSSIMFLISVPHYPVSNSISMYEFNGLYVQSSWLSEEEFGMGHIDLKPASSRTVTGIWEPIKLLCLNL